MPKYTGINGEVREITSQYTGVNGEVREIKEEYCGVNGEVRTIFSSMPNDLIQMLGKEVTWYGGYYSESEGTIDYSSSANKTSNASYSKATDKGIVLHGDGSGYKTWGVVVLQLDSTGINNIKVKFTHENSNVKLQYKIHKKSTTSLFKAMDSCISAGSASLSSGGVIGLSAYNQVIYLTLYFGLGLVGGTTGTITEMIIE